MTSSKNSETTKLRVLIVDDEEHVRVRIGSLIGERNRLEIIGEAGDGIAAVEKVNQLRPDIVFLDIQMPGLNGMDVVHCLPEEINPAIVFVTAFDQYAVKAFEVNAIDYVLKPIDKDRFWLAVDRAEEKAKLQIRTKPLKSDEQGISRKVSYFKPCEKLLVKLGGSQKVISTSEIQWIEAADKYVRLHCIKTSYLMRRTMKQLEELLAGSGFIRIHRSTIVNMESITEVKPINHGDWQIKLHSDQLLVLSRSYRDQFRSRFNKGE